MHPDLKSLIISESNFREIAGIDSHTAMERLPNASLAERLLLIAASVISAYLAILLRLMLTDAAALLSITTVSNFIIGLFSGGSVFLGGVLFWNNQRRSKLKAYRDLETLRKLALEVCKYNDVVRMIDVKDQLEEAGNSISSFEDRGRVVQALQLARVDFIRALKTERILRENKDLIAQNPAAFESNLTTIQALQINNQGTEWGQVLNQALVVVVEVHNEMRKLQGR